MGDFLSLGSGSVCLVALAGRVCGGVREIVRGAEGKTRVKCTDP